MTDDFSRSLAEVQAAHAELMSCYIAGRSTKEAEADYKRVIKRATDIAADLQRRATNLDLAIKRAEANIPVGL